MRTRQSTRQWLLTGAAILATCASTSVVTAGQPRGGSAATVALVPLTAAGPDDRLSALPTAEHYAALGGTFIVEVWAQTADPAGLSSVSTDIAFDTTVSVNSVTHTALFSELGHDIIDNPAGRIDDLSGSHLGPCTDLVGVAPEWARVAIIEMAADSPGLVTIASSDPGSLIYGTAVCGVGDLDPATISYGSDFVAVGQVPVPAVTTWGLAAMTLLVAVAATLAFRRDLRLEPAPALTR